MTAELAAFLRSDEAVLNLVVLLGTSEHPSGDTLHLDVLNGAANRVFDQFRTLGIVERGSVVAETVDTWLSDTATTAERRQPRFEAFAPVWEMVDARIRSDGTYPPGWFVLLVIAGLIAAVGILINSQILIVAAMVVGPEYGAITSVARAGTRRDGSTVVRGLLALLVGFAAAIAACIALGRSSGPPGSRPTPSSSESARSPTSSTRRTCSPSSSPCSRASSGSCP